MKYSKFNFGRKIEIDTLKACVFGIHESIIIDLIHSMSKENNDCEFAYATITQKEFNEYMPFVNRAKIRRLLSSLREQGIIHSINTQSEKFDRTLSYYLDYHLINKMLDEYSEL